MSDSRVFQTKSSKAWKKVAKEVEQVAEESCKKWKEAELEKEKTGPQQGKLKGSFDVSWRKQQGYNSIVGHGAIFGYHTKSVLITELRTLIAEHTNNQREWVNQYMSTIVVRTTAEVLKLWRLVFQRSFLEKGDYSVMLTDEDTSSESKVKQNVNHDIEKWSDKNHFFVTFKKC